MEAYLVNARLLSKMSHTLNYIHPMDLTQMKARYSELYQVWPENWTIHKKPINWFCLHIDYLAAALTATFHVRLALMETVVSPSTHFVLRSRTAIFR